MQTIIARWPAPQALPLVAAEASVFPAKAGTHNPGVREIGKTRPGAHRALLAALGPLPAPPPRHRDLATTLAILGGAGASVCAVASALAAFGLRHGWWL